MNILSCDLRVWPLCMASSHRDSGYSIIQCFSTGHIVPHPRRTRICIEIGRWLSITINSLFYASNQFDWIFNIMVLCANIVCLACNYILTSYILFVISNRIFSWWINCSLSFLYHYNSVKLPSLDSSLRGAPVFVGGRSMKWQLFQMNHNRLYIVDSPIHKPKLSYINVCAV